MIVWDEVHAERMGADVREVRARVRKALVGCGDGFDLDDVELMVCEIATNAVRHSASGKSEGGVWVRVLVAEERLRVEVRDDGEAEGCPVIPEQGAGWEESGRGLMVVDGLADRWETLAGRDGRHTVWFEVVR
ncbi:ATP-binding protein [Actinomadura sp. 9N215]|uniref:ATP-binding protein n=1 Tax=Actinomadura sp. 9N215 TaxID=3375150 RepID=UPI003792879F